MAADPLWVNADVTRLEQVFANLLQNAAKYTDRGGSITVKVETVPGESEGTRSALVSVKDDGMGIEPELLPRVFDLFAQGDRSLARTQGGLGIGLHIVRSLVELHGGRVEARSEGNDQGSEFRVYLPVNPVAEQPEALLTGAEIASHPQPRLWHVLVVDDNADIVDSTAMLLSLQGHTVRTALNGQEALEIARHFHPDLVLLDIGMPGVDGYAIARRMRGQPETEHSLLIAVSGYGSDEDRAKARAAGFDLHFVKPLDVKLLEQLEVRRQQLPTPTHAPEAVLLTASDARLPPGPTTLQPLR
jgi:CheY-like chemotaxis protein